MNNEASLRSYVFIQKYEDQLQNTKKKKSKGRNKYTD